MELMEKYQLFILSTNFMFVNNVPFFKTYSRDIRFIASRNKGLKKNMTLHAMKSIKAYYAKRGFRIVGIERHLLKCRLI